MKEEFEIVLVHTANFFFRKQGAETASGKKCCYYELMYTSSDSKSNTFTHTKWEMNFFAASLRKDEDERVRESQEEGEMQIKKLTGIKIANRDVRQ